MKGRVTVVTGASQGIGRTIAEFLAEKGSDLILLDVADAQELAVDLSKKGRRVIFHPLDVGDFQVVERTINEVAKEMGRIDCLVNNAGITRDKLLLRMSEDDWDQVMRVNLKGVFNCTKAVLRHMLKRGGSIVSVSSVTGLMGNAGQSNYAASKAGLIGFTKSIAKEYGERNIRANAVAPGFIETAMTGALDEGVKERMKQAIPLRRTGEPLDVARVVYFLLSDYSTYVTGEVINVSGGLYI